MSESDQNHCSECGAVLHVYPDKHGGCPNGHGKLVPPASYDYAVLLKQQRAKIAAKSRAATRRAIAKLPFAEFNLELECHMLGTVPLLPIGPKRRGKPPELAHYGEVMLRISDSQWRVFADPNDKS